MADFFASNFTEEKWKKAALKNAFVLMSKQRFEHAAAFFMLGGALKDAVQVGTADGERRASDALQTCLINLKDVQLALVIIRLYEADPDRQNQLMRELLCRQVTHTHHMLIPKHISYDHKVTSEPV